MIIAPPRFISPYNPSGLGMEYEDVSFKTLDGVEIKGWLIKSESRKQKTENSIILCHGYGADKGDVLGIARFIYNPLANGYNILVFDFRAHGKSGGKYSSLGYYETEDLKSAIRFLKQRGVDRIGLMGISMGGTVALMVASEFPEIKAIVSDGAYLSFHSVIYSFARRHYHSPRYPFLPPAIWTAGLRLGFNPKRLDLKRYTPGTALIIHGEEDREVLPFDAEEIFKYAKEPKELWMVKGADHLESYDVAREEYERRVINFFKRYL